MIRKCDPRIKRAMGLDQPSARRNIAGGINAIADVGPELIESLRTGEQAADAHNRDWLVRMHGSIRRQEVARPEDALFV